MSNNNSQNRQASQPNSTYRIIGSPVAVDLKAYTPEWGLYKYLEAWTPEVMQIAIKKNFEWDLSQHVDTIISYAADEILNWFKKYRPDLHEVLKTSEGRKWLKMNIKTSMTPK